MSTEYFLQSPRLDYYRFPENEQDAVKRTDRALMSVADHICKFRYALQLYDMCFHALAQRLPVEEHSKMTAWKFIAGRDGSMQLYHVGKALGYVDSARKRSQTLASHMDLPEYKLADKLFTSSFPGHENVRHAVGHAAEFSDRMDEHIAKGSPSNRVPGVELEDDATIMIPEGFEGKKYFSTVDGRAVSYDLSNESLAKLESVHQHLCKGFAPVEAAIREIKGPRMGPDAEKLKQRERP